MSGTSPSSKRKVLVICQHFWPETFRINDICDFLVEKHCDVEVLCGLPNYPKGVFTEGYGYFKNRRQVHNGVRIRRALEIPRGNNSNFRIFLNYISFPLSSLFHIPRLLFGKYDKILLYQLSPVMMSIAGIVVGRIKKVETTMYVLDLWPENLFSVLNVRNRFARALITNISHWHYRHVDKLVALSERMKDRLVEVSSIDGQKIIVIPQAAEKIYEESIRDETLVEKFKDTFNIVFAGNISPAQSFSTIIQAAEIIRDKKIKDIHWVIVGDGMSRKDVEKQIKDKELHTYFTFEGQKPVAEVPRYTFIADLLVGCLVKSDLLEATIPAKVMSYIAAGKPIVLAMDGEVKQLINDQIRCGFVSETEDAKALASNILKIYHMSNQERSKLGKRAYDYHVKHFERNHLLSKLYHFVFN